LVPSLAPVIAAACFVAPIGCTKDKDTAAPSAAPPASVGVAAPPASVATRSAPVAAAAGVDAGAPAPARPPADLDVLVISIDSLRADMPWAGYPRPIAPRLTALEAQSVSYTEAHSISSYTSMSLGGFLGGKLPSELSRDGYFFGTYAKSNLFFPEVLQKAGIVTLSAHAHGYFKNAGFEQGFDKYEIVQGLKWNNTTDENVTGPQQEAIAERLLGDAALAEPKTRFFAWFHFLDPHDRYMAHDKDGISYGKSLRDRYDGEVTFCDRQIGKLLDFVHAQPWGARTAIIVTADHGEAFGEHHQYVHGFELWENLVHVPLFVSLPGVAPRRVTTPRSALDLAPTILDLFGLPAEPTFRGTSLVPELYGADQPPRDVPIDLPATSDNDRRRALIHVEGKALQKVIAFGAQNRMQAFDLDADPGELAPISSGEMFTAMSARLKALDAETHDLPPTSCKEGCLNGGYAKKKPD
jgi:choline-sulfatase